jgi:hypothetical protein
MAKRLYATHPDHRRTINFTFRMSKHERARLTKLWKSSGARIFTRFVRAKLLTNDEFKVPPFETVRDLRNQVVQVGILLQETGCSPETQDSVVRAMDAIASAF